MAKTSGSYCKPAIPERKVRESNLAISFACAVRVGLSCAPNSEPSAVVTGAPVTSRTQVLTARFRGRFAT